MLTIETIVYIIGGVSAIGFPLLGIIWSLHREEIKSHTEELKKKADQIRMTDIESRLEKDISTVKHENTRLLEKLEDRYDKQIEQLEVRLTSSMKTMESNIMTQMNMIMSMLQKKD